MTPTSRAPAARPRPRRGRRLAMLLVLLVLVLVGRGLGWVGSIPTPGPADPASPGAAAAGAAPVAAGPNRDAAAAALPPDPAGQPSAEPPPAPTPSAPAGDVAAAAKPAPPPTEPAAAEPEPTPVVAPAAVPAPLPEPAPTPSVAPPPAVDQDRFASLLSLVDARLAEQRSGSALRVLDQLAALPLDAAQRAGLATRQRAAELAVGAFATRIVAAVASGEVVLARALAAAALADEGERTAPELAVALSPLGLPGRLTAAPVAGDTPWPVPVPLARERRVRVVLAGREVEGTVVDSRGERATVRIAGAAGVTFPTVPTTALQPVAVTGAEAIELGLAALHAGDGLLARLWLAAATQRGAPNDDRRRRLADALE